MITFGSLIPVWLVAAIFIPLCFYLLWKESGKKYRFKALRLLAVCIMTATLAGIILRPQYRRHQTGSILLLTEGYDVKKADSLIAAYPELIIRQTPGTPPLKDAVALKSLYELARLQNNVRFVLGQGLPTYALDLMDNKSFSFLPTPTGEGITEIAIPRRLFAHRQSSITGTFHNTAEAKWIYLEGPGGKLDSTRINERGDHDFSLSFTPRQAGNQLYSINIKDSLGSHTNDNLPLVVNAFTPLKIIIILGYPSFETTYLKNFLASKKNEVVLRSQLSRNNFGYEYVNHAPLRFSRISTELLTEFDLLIADETTLEKLSPGESEVLKRAIQSGLGFLPLQASSKGNLDKTFFSIKTTPVKVDTTRVHLGATTMTMHANPIRAINKAPIQSILENKSGILSGYTLRGKGKIGFQFLQDTYQLSLSGDSIAYSTLWSPLLEKIARVRKQDSSIDILTPFPLYPDLPLQVRVISTESSPLLLADSTEVPLQEDVEIDDVWNTTLWGGPTGWHKLQIGNSTLDYYISKKEEWSTLRIHIQKEANGNLNSASPSTITTTEQREIPLLLFFILFLIAGGFVWLAPKL